VTMYQSHKAFYFSFSCYSTKKNTPRHLPLGSVLPAKAKTLPLPRVAVIVEQPWTAPT
jgi:hypothetical protein